MLLLPTAAADAAAAAAAAADVPLPLLLPLLLLPTAAPSLLPVVAVSFLLVTSALNSPHFTSITTRAAAADGNDNPHVC